MQEHKPLIIQPANEENPHETPQAIINDDPAPVVAEKVRYIPNRHKRRKQAALERKERREKRKVKR